MSDKQELIRYVYDCKTYSEFLSSVISYCTTVSKQEFIHPFDIRIPDGVFTNLTPSNGYPLSDSTREYFLSKTRDQVLMFWEFLSKKEIEIIALKSGVIKGVEFSDEQISQILDVTAVEIMEAVEAIEYINHYYIGRRKIKTFLD